MHVPSGLPYLHQAHCLLTPYVGRLDEEGNKVDASKDVRILGDLIIINIIIIIIIIIILNSGILILG